MAMTDEQNLFLNLASFVDCTGQKRIFKIKQLPSPNKGYLLEARELRDDAREGYKFQQFSAASVHEALGLLRRKIRRGLARRHVYEGPRELDLLADDMAGHISSGGVIVDGCLIEFDRLIDLLQTYEAWNLELRFIDPSK
jgi:hypothetical protein